MSQVRSTHRSRLRWALPIALAITAAACGGGDAQADSDDDSSVDAAAEETAEDPPADDPPADDPPADDPPADDPPADDPPADDPPAPPGPWEPYTDGENDCQRNSDYAPAPMCIPPDIDTVSITRGSPLTIITVFYAAVVTTDWQYTIGFDLDNDPTTGITDGIWSDLHEIGPDLEFDYFADIGDGPFSQIHEIAPGPVFTMLEGGPPDAGPLAIWTWTDDRTLQLVISDMLVPDDVSGFEVAGQTMTPDYHDAIPNDPTLTWP